LPALSIFNADVVQSSIVIVLEGKREFVALIFAVMESMKPVEIDNLSPEKKFNQQPIK
jgi:hypothetical protein